MAKDGHAAEHAPAMEHTKALLSIRVTPRARRESVTRDGERVQVHLRAAPVDGAANSALLSLLSNRLGVPRSRLQIVRGERGREKVIAIDGLSLTEALARLNTEST